MYPCWVRNRYHSSRAHCSHPDPTHVFTPTPNKKQFIHTIQPFGPLVGPVGTSLARLARVPRSRTSLVLVAR
eukprot:5534088-Prymnesium_polylepis.1